ncbi:MAG: GIY-YIG nuclease family protein [Bacteroidia bacterium]
MYFIYIIYSTKADKYYTGYSEDPWIRLSQHNSNPLERYTGKFKDWELKAVFKVSENRSQAILLEKFIKKQKAENY